MATTFLKRQKEMKRQEKQREKAERRAQKKLAARTGNDGSSENADSIETLGPFADDLTLDGPRDSETHQADPTTAKTPLP